MRSEINTIITTLLPEEVITFENELYSEWDYYEHKYADDEIIRYQIHKEFKGVDICDILDEVRDYAYKKTYLCALESWLNKQDMME